MYSISQISSDTLLVCSQQNKLGFLLLHLSQTMQLKQYFSMFIAEQLWHSLTMFITNLAQAFGQNVYCRLAQVSFTIFIADQLKAICQYIYCRLVKAICKIFIVDQVGQSVTIFITDQLRQSVSMLIADQLRLSVNTFIADQLRQSVTILSQIRSSNLLFCLLQSSLGNLLVY